jgi:hypothetical protein
MGMHNSHFIEMKVAADEKSCPEMQMILKENKIFQLKSFRLLRRLDKKNRK